MTNTSAKPDTGERLVRSAIIWLQRFAGLLLFALGVAYWIRLVGVFPGPDWRFDLMSPQWRVAACVLAVLCPVAGVGLWLSTSWGTVVWVLVAAIEVVMHTALEATFGRPGLETIALVAGLVCFAALRMVRWMQRRGVRRTERTG